MALRLPEHSHCNYCGDPVPYGEEYCSEECRENHRNEDKKTRIRDIAFYVTVGLALIILAYRLI